MYHSFSEEELRSLCRSNLENFEIWARQLIHEQMCKEYGDNYFNYKNPDGNYMIKTSIITEAKERMQKEPNRFSRLVDTLYFDDIIYFLCNRNWYDKLFKKVFQLYYPLGCEQLRNTLNMLLPIRNSLSHANPISIRQAERAICYSHDIIECIKEYYKNMGEEQIWNVPQIIRISDSNGNVYNHFDSQSSIAAVIIEKNFSVGDIFSISIEVDPSFEDSEYDVIWEWKNEKIYEWRNKKMICYKFQEKDIGLSNYLHCYIVSHKKWHKFASFDHQIMYKMEVLPPRT